MLMQINRRPFNINIIQVCRSTAGKRVNNGSIGTEKSPKKKTDTSVIVGNCKIEKDIVGNVDTVVKESNLFEFYRQHEL